MDDLYLGVFVCRQNVTTKRKQITKHIYSFHFVSVFIVTFNVNVCEGTTIFQQSEKRNIKWQTIIYVLS